MDILPMNPPKVQPYKRHVFICIGTKCDEDGNGEGEKIYAALKDAIGSHNLADPPVGLKRSKTTCLNHCHGGPLMVVYPEGVWYGKLTMDKARRILEEHLIGGKPVQEFILHDNHCCEPPQ